MGDGEARRQIGLRLRAIRHSKGLSQEAVGHQSRLTPSYVGSIERGVRSATIDTLEKLCVGLGISLADLLAPEELRLGEEIRALIQDIPSRLRVQTLQVVRESILFLRGAAIELSAGRRPVGPP